MLLSVVIPVYDEEEALPGAAGGSATRPRHAGM